MADTLRLSPVICAYPDDNYENFLIEVVLPGVEKKDISFKIIEDSFYVALGKRESSIWTVIRPAASKPEKSSC